MNKETTDNSKFIKDISFLLLLSLAMSLPLFCNKIMAMPDGEYAFIKSITMFQAWKDGDLICRWTPYLITGLGYPMFNYYAPLFSYFSAFLMTIGIPVFFAFNLGLILIQYFSGISMYLFARKIWGREGGLLSAAAYLMAPYHILDLYARAVMAEYTAFVFYPLIMLAIYRIMRENNLRNMYLGIFSCAGLILSHNISAFIFFPAVCFYLLFLYFTDTARNIKKLWAGASMLAGGCLVTAYFWLPALVEKKYILIQKLTVGIYNYQDHFIFLKELFNSPWPTEVHGLSFALGAVYILMFSSVIIFSPKLAKSIKGAGPQILFFTLLFVISIFFMLKISLPLWKIIPLMPFTEFPWRIMICTSFAISLLVGGFVLIFPRSIQKSILWASLGAIILSNIFLCHAFGYQDIKYTAPIPYLKSSMPMDNMEYLPKWVQYISLFPDVDKLEIVRGYAAIAHKKGNALDQRYHYNADSQLIFCYHSYYFPGWTVELDGKPASLIYNNSYGVIMFKAPGGEHDIRVHFGTTAVRQIGDWITLISLGLLLLLIIPWSKLTN